MEATRDFFLWALLQWYGAPIVMISISAAYFFADQRRPAYIARLVSSAHGLLGAGLYVGAMVVFVAGPQEHRPHLALPYISLFALPVVAIIISFFTFRGNPLVHLLQPLNLAAMAWALFVGGMAVTGDWL